jgi:hypothetical protein
MSAQLTEVARMIQRESGIVLSASQLPSLEAANHQGRPQPDG